MATKATKVSRTLVVKMRLPTAEAINSISMMMKSATPFYKLFGDAKVRLLRNVELQEITIEAHRLLEVQDLQRAMGKGTTHRIDVHRITSRDVATVGDGSRGRAP